MTTDTIDSKEIDNLLNKFKGKEKSSVEEQETKEEEEKKKKEEKQVSGLGLLISHAIGETTRIFAKNLDVPEIAFSEQDEKQLGDALGPLEPYFIQWIKYLPYLPLLIFAGGYMMRVIKGFRDKKKKDEEKKIEEQKKLQMQRKESITATKEEKPREEVKKDATDGSTAVEKPPQN
jgi:Na+-transporting methylmalonyl-CoA/oxaloacetate decarboxylase gamma subunit